ncbi:hypothetical protein NQ314_015003, partial [Rhamnusium bicolor]
MVLHVNNKRKKSNSFIKCSLVQMDICEAINKWKYSQKMKKIEKDQKVFSTVIEIDSDSEASDNSDCISSITDRKLACSFWSDEEVNEIIHVKQESGPDINAVATPRDIVNMVVNKPKSNPHLMRPEACSTPLKVSKFNTNDAHVSAPDLSMILSDNTKTYNQSGTVLGTDSETTLIYHESTSPNKIKEKVRILGNQIISGKSNGTNSTHDSNNIAPSSENGKRTSEISEKQIHSKSTPKPMMKRVAEKEIGPKRQKIETQKLNQGCSKSPEEREVVRTKSKNKVDNCKTSKSKGEIASRKIDYEGPPKTVASDNLNYSNDVTRRIDDTGVRSSSVSPTLSNKNRKIRLIEQETIQLPTNKTNSISHSSNATSPLSKNARTFEKMAVQMDNKITISPKRRVGEDEILSKRQKFNNLDDKEKIEQFSKKLCDISIEKVEKQTTNNNYIVATKNQKNPETAAKGKLTDKIVIKCLDGSGVKSSSDGHNNMPSQVGIVNGKKMSLKVRKGTVKIPNEGNDSGGSAKNMTGVYKGETVIKSTERNQTLNKAASLPSCSNSPEKVNRTQSAYFVARKEGSDNESVQSNTKKTQPLSKSDCQSNCSKSPEKPKANNESASNTTGKENDKNVSGQSTKIILSTPKGETLLKSPQKMKSLDKEDSYVGEMYNFFKENGIIDTDFTKEDTRALLELLDPNDLKNIRDTFRLKKTLVTKQDIINGLLKCCSTQSTLTPKKSTHDLLMQEIELKLGHSVRLSENFHDAFHRTYVLATFANPAFSKMTDYFNNILHLNIKFPDYPVENYTTIFYTRDEFLRYAVARKYKDELEEFIGKYHMDSLEICKVIFNELQKIKDVENGDEGRYRDAPHLVRFTARSVYVSALSSAVMTLATKFPMEVQKWLEFMIKEVNFSHRLGEWYYHLSWLYMNYLEPRDYTHAAKLIIEVLLDKREDLSEVQLHLLGMRGEALKVSKKYKIDQLYHDTIAQLVPVQIDKNDFPSREVKADTIRSNQLGTRRNYIIQDAEGNKTVLSVEYIALKYYMENGYTDGRHCEGSLIKATFTLFFWDIIYSVKDIIPGTFVIKNMQSEPLDMNTKYFYLNRKEAINQRLKEIESEWSHSEMIKFLKDKYTLHSHELAFCEVGVYIKDEELLEILIDCIGRK